MYLDDHSSEEKLFQSVSILEPPEGVEKGQ